jgi:endo-1,4-beta-xylanase
MQSHLGTNYPSVDYYMQALNAFLRAGFEVQITEIDITNKGDSDMANYAYNLFKKINAAKKNGGKITGVTWWGLSDQTTWISNSAPLLFSRPGVTKQSYNKVIQAYTEVIGQPGSAPRPTPTPTPKPTPTPTPSQNVDSNSTANIADGWYYLKNTLSQKYLTVEGNTGKAVTNVCISKGTGVDGQKWYVENRGNGYITLKSGLGNFMLDVANGVDEDGANLQIYDGYAGNAQQFIVKNTNKSGIYTIATKASNGTKYVDVYEHKTADGTNVCQWTYYGNPNQQWQFEKVNGGSQAQPTPTPTPAPTAKPTPTPAPQPSTESGLTAKATVNSWGSGYTASIKVSNNTGKTVNGWTLKLKKSEVKMDSSWNVNVKESGDSYVLTPVDWNSSIPNGGSVEFGFNGSGNVGSISIDVQ